jgi:hypothetical protein
MNNTENNLNKKPQYIPYLKNITRELVRPSEEKNIK